MTTQASGPAQRSEAPPGSSEALEEAVTRGLARARRLLPAQAPLSTFVAANTLEAFQSRPFHDALLEAQRDLGGEPYLSEREFRECLARGRIDASDLRAALSQTIDPTRDRRPIALGLDELELRLVMLRHAIGDETEPSLNWLIDEHHLTSRLRADVGPVERERILEGTRRWLRSRQQPCAPPAELESLAVAALWSTCCDVCQGLRLAPPQAPSALKTHRDVLLEATGEDAFDRVFPALIRLAAAFLDEGLAHSAMPERELGFYGAVRKLVAHGGFSFDGTTRRARALFRTQLQRGDSAMAVVCDSLRELGVELELVEAYLERTILSLPGWAGMMSWLEEQSEETRRGGPPCSLLDFVAVRLTHERAALCGIAETHAGAHAGLAELWKRGRARRPVRESARASELRCAYRLFQLAQVRGFCVVDVAALSAGDALRIVLTMDRFGELARRRVFQEAYERLYRRQLLGALASNLKHVAEAAQEPPTLQVITCFDDREESFRRHLEEVEPACETYGAPGFFGAAIRFRSLDQRLHETFAPVQLEPMHHVDERVLAMDVELHRSRQRRRRWWGLLRHQGQVGSRSLARGFLLNVALGAVALLPLVARTLSPRSAGRVSRFAERYLLPMPRTDLLLHCDSPGDGPVRRFLVDERVARVATVLENIGLLERFAPLVIVLGHGSTTLNNPHASAYECGACSGRKGGINARVFAQMANDALVRQGLLEVGIRIPHGVVFVGGEHDTSSDAIHLFDLQQVHDTHRALLDRMRTSLEAARARNAQERCRRMRPFSAPLEPTPTEALRHVEARAEHLAEPRPELSHQGNATLVVGRRRITRGLFLDWRAFLLSYDATRDPEGAILERTLAAAIPVGVGINLQYYFSRVDNERYGAGSKLPHNVVGLVGVMSGHCSDLRTGLPQQMVDVHEPQRLLTIVEAAPAVLLRVLARQTEIQTLAENAWFHLLSLHPETGQLAEYDGRAFVPVETGNRNA